MSTRMIHRKNLKVALFFLLLSICKAVEIKEIYKWSYINYTWPSQLAYQYYYQTGGYIPENNIPSSIKIYGGRYYISLGRFYSGTPATLGFITTKEKSSSPLVTPYPSWDMNIQNDCTTLQNVNAFDIDKNGIMWILDGLRHNNLTACPAKLVLYNVTSKRMLSSYDFPSEGDLNGAYLADMTIDGNFAYITDSNTLDPGIIIYSRYKNKSWKLRDASMFPDAKGSKFTIGNKKYNYYHGVGSIAVSPPANSKKTRYIFYSPVSSMKIYKLNVAVIQNEDTLSRNAWREYVHVAGTKVDQSYNYAINRNGDMYFCMLNKNALAKWNIDKEFRTATYYAQNDMFNWCTGSTIANDYLYLISGNVGDYLITGAKPTIQKNVFRLVSVLIKNKKKHN